MQILVLDDDPHRHAYFRRTLNGHMVMHCSTYQATTMMLAALSPFDVCYLDRDLNQWGAVSKNGNTELTGEDVVDYILKELPQEKWPRQVIIHSQNREGAKRMFDALDAAGIYAVLDPFPHVTIRT